MAILYFARKRKRRDMAMQVRLTAQATRGKPRSINKLARDLERG